jgi:hypothetical protein
MYYLCNDNLNEIHTLKTDKPFFYRLKKAGSGVCLTTLWQRQEIPGRSFFPCIVRQIILILFDNALFYHEELLRRIKFSYPLFYTSSSSKEKVAVVHVYPKS